jgi:hypothetical protein
VRVRYVDEHVWSASALINEIPTGHAVIALNSVRGAASPKARLARDRHGEFTQAGY